MHLLVAFPLLFICQPTSDLELENLTTELAKQRYRLTKLLEDEKLWTDPKRRTDLLACLKLAKLFPDPKMAPVLLKRISFCPDPAHDIPPFRTIEEVAPAFGVLVTIGLPAVAPPIERLKKIDSEDDNARIMVLLVKRIYEKAGFGREMAIQRLDRELSRTNDAQEKANLVDAIERLQRGRDAKGNVIP
jgi:hypothetical protein